MKVLATGATGFVGRGVLSALRRSPGVDIALTCRTGDDLAGHPSRHVVGDLNGETDWSTAIAGQHAVIHMAGLAHALGREAATASAFDLVNHRATAHLATACARAGVKRFVFLSSVSVFGRTCTEDEPISPNSPIRPQTAYAESKVRAEDALRSIAAVSGMELVVIRPPIVYGPAAPGNFGRLIRLVRSRVPLPLAHVDNRRSMVALPNLADLVVHCLNCREAAGQAVLVSDDDDVSTPRLLRSMASAMGIRPLLFPAPASMVDMALRITAGVRTCEQLTKSFRVDISQTKRLLGWTPPHSFDRCIAASVNETDN